MSNSREEVLKEWNRLLEEVSEFLEIVRKRNSLMKKCADKESHFSKMKEAYKKMICDVKNFLNEDADNFKNADAIKKGNEFISALEDDLYCIKKKSNPFLQQYDEVVRLTNLIEEKIDVFSESVEEFFDIKLKKGEYSEEKIYEMVAIILIANFNHSKINESSYFSLVDEFHELLKNSEDSSLSELLEYDPDNITTHNWLYDFLDAI